MQRSTTSAIVFRVPENVIFVVKYAAIVTLVGTLSDCIVVIVFEVHQLNESCGGVA